MASFCPSLLSTSKQGHHAEGAVCLDDAPPPLSLNWASSNREMYSRGLTSGSPSPLRIICSPILAPRRPETAKLILTHGGSHVAEMEDESHYTLVSFSSELLELLISHGADINKPFPAAAGANDVSPLQKVMARSHVSSLLGISPRLEQLAFVEYEDRRDADEAYHDTHDKRMGRDDILKMEWARTTPSASWRFDRTDGDQLHVH
ncbi:hypothetical protein B0T24DRAFT_692825 [Lasiosphaeria ovina]|uniref:Ankyrin repeat protein n=1 Tax=Lasiosphaeria ovina TaxID=92902 RepID=A0AAE0JS45_9PEZI|nr:hypothetical protein B0T24DRAFT_692825 [Lasiosphaeria ovina]